MAKAKVYLVEDCAYSPGRILAVFADQTDAEDFADALPEAASVEERTLFYGQPPTQGYNQ